MNFHQVKASTIENFKKAKTSFLALWYFKLMLRTKLTSQNIWFFKICLKNNLTPKYMKLKSNNKSMSVDKAIRLGMRRWLQEDMKIEYNKRDVYSVYLKCVHSELLNRLHNVEFDVLDFKVRCQVQTIVHKKYLTQLKKLNNLQKSNHHVNRVNPRSNHVFYQRFLNLSTVNFNSQEIKLLERGFKFNVQTVNDQKDFERLGVDCDLTFHNYCKSEQIPVSDMHIEKHMLANKIKQLHIESKNKNNLNSVKLLDTSTIKSIRHKTIDSKTSENKVIFTRADKGNTVIAIDKENYIEKTLDFLKDYECSRSDPTKEYQTEIVDAIKKCSFFNNTDLYALKVMNPQAPKLYSQLKIHKPEIPIRPVVSYVSAPATKVSKRLVTIITTNTNFKPKHTLKNTQELVENIRDSVIPEKAILLSFDVKNLFPSIPPNEVLEITEQLLTSQKCNQSVKEDILFLYKTCLNQNYFEFNNNIYLANDCLAMGNPLSPLSAEIFMDKLEAQIRNHPYFILFLFWYRYVDDIFACFLGTRRQLDIFFKFINNLHHRIKFTIELEENNSINFLDLTISKTQNRLTFSIFHKPTHTDMVIPNCSLHPYKYKLAAFHCYTHRLLNIPLSQENYEKELNIIKQIAFNNGYDPKLIDNLIKQKLYNKALNLVYPYQKSQVKIYNSIIYLGKPSDRIHNYFKSKGVNVAFKTNSSLGRYIRNNKSKTRKEQKSGVYKLTCGSCDKLYLGQTGRSFAIRVNDHKLSYNRKDGKSNYANHLIDKEHVFNEEFEVLHVASKGPKLNLLESLEINKFKSKNILLNDQIDLNSSPLLNLYC